MKNNLPPTWLIPIDDSEVAPLPIDWFIDHYDDWKTPPMLHLINVQPALPQNIGRFISVEQIDAYYREEGLKVLTPIEEKLRSAGIAFTSHITAGSSAETIASFAQQLKCTQILMGTRGHSGIVGSLLGSVATRVASLTNIPLLLIR